MAKNALTSASLFYFPKWMNEQILRIFKSEYIWENLIWSLKHCKAPWNLKTHITNLSSNNRYPYLFGWLILLLRGALQAVKYTSPHFQLLDSYSYHLSHNNWPSLCRFGLINEFILFAVRIFAYSTVF